MYFGQVVVAGLIDLSLLIVVWFVGLPIVCCLLVWLIVELFRCLWVCEFANSI